jgi:hypothetical protein
MLWDANTVNHLQEIHFHRASNKGPGGKQLDFLVHHKTAGYAGLEVKNIREWIYPGRDDP